MKIGILAIASVCAASYQDVANSIWNGFDYRTPTEVLETYVKLGKLIPNFPDSVQMVMPLTRKPLMIGDQQDLVEWQQTVEQIAANLTDDRAKWAFVNSVSILSGIQYRSMELWQNSYSIKSLLELNEAVKDCSSQLGVVGRLMLQYIDIKCGWYLYSNN